jgi:hypothetical protein
MGCNIGDWNIPLPHITTSLTEDSEMHQITAEIVPRFFTKVREFSVIQFEKVIMSEQQCKIF